MDGACWDVIFCLFERPLLSLMNHYYCSWGNSGWIWIRVLGRVQS